MTNNAGSVKWSLKHNKRCLQLPTVRISPSYLLITGVGSPLVGGPGLGGWCPAPPCAPSCWHLRTHRGHTDGWPQGGQLIGEKLQKCWSFKGCPWTGSKHFRSAGPLQWAMVVGWWIVEWHEMCGQQRRIETYFTPSLAIDGGAAAGQTQPRPTVMVHTPSATPQPLKPTPIFIWFDKCILTAFVKTWTLGPERAH